METPLPVARTTDLLKKSTLQLIAKMPEWLRNLSCLGREHVFPGHSRILLQGV